MRALIVEPNPFHFEVLPGFAWHFASLGYEVDVLVQGHESWGDEFCRCPQLRNRIGMYTYRDGELGEALPHLLRSSHYDAVFFSSIEFVPRSLIEFCIEEGGGGIRVCGCVHEINRFKASGDDDLMREGRIATLSPTCVHDCLIPEINAHFFCDAPSLHRKGNPISIVAIGASLDKAGLCRAAAEARSLGWGDVHLTLIGRRDRYGDVFHHNGRCLKRYVRWIVFRQDYDRSLFRLWIPTRRLRKDVVHLSNVPFSALYNEVEQSDFLACNISGLWRDDFASIRTTGVKQLSLGFLKPCIIERHLADYYGFSDSTAIVYEEGGLRDALVRALRMSSAEYDDMRGELARLQHDIELRSQQNLAAMLAP